MLASMNHYKPTGMNIELTNACPLRCPQCYCSLEGGVHIPYETAAKNLMQAKNLGIKHVELSGGETLCYPHLFDLVHLANDLGLEVSIAISGWHFTEECLDKLIHSGITNIFVSLNGPTEEINRLTRDGFQYAISALELLKKKEFPNVYINWVMHRNNADFLGDMVELAEKYAVRAIVVLAPKPTSHHELNTYPTPQQMRDVAEQIRNSGHGKIKVEACFSPLLAMVMDTKLLGNLNRGRYKGCGAGMNLLSVSLDGRFTPCRHLEYFEQWDSLEEYWEKSPILRQIRKLENQKNGPCISCKYCDHCRHCLAINSKLKGQLIRENEHCPAFVEK